MKTPKTGRAMTPHNKHATAIAVSLSHSRSVLAPAHLRGGTSSRVSNRVCGPRCRQVALLSGVCLARSGSAWKLLEKAAYAVPTGMHIIHLSPEALTLLVSRCRFKA